MTSTSTIHLWCQTCDTKFAFEVFDVLDLRVYPDQKASVLAGRLNTHSCPGCRTDYFIDQPILYTDPDLGFCVQYYPSSMLEKQGFFDCFTPEGEFSLFPESVPPDSQFLYRPHIVFHIDELTSYVQFRDRLAASYQRLEYSANGLESE